MRYFANAIKNYRPNKRALVWVVTILIVALYLHLRNLRETPPAINFETIGEGHCEWKEFVCDIQRRGVQLHLKRQSKEQWLIRVVLLPEFPIEINQVQIQFNKPKPTATNKHQTLAQISPETWQGIVSSPQIRTSKARQLRVWLTNGNQIMELIIRFNH